MTMARQRRSAFTVYEVLVASIIFAILAGLALNSAAQVEGNEIEAGGRLFHSMVEYAQSASITRSDVGYLVKVDSDAEKFWLATAAAPNTPITHPVTRKPFVVQLGNGSPQGLTAIQITGYDLGGDNVVRFDGTGAMDQDTPATIEFGIGSERYEIEVDPWLGKLKVNNQTVIGVEAIDMGG